MALWEEHTYSNMADYLAKLAAFGTANGWTVSTSTASTVVMSKGEATLTTTDGGSHYANRSMTVGGLTSGIATEFQLGVDRKFGFISCGVNLFFYTEYWHTTTTFQGVYFGGAMQITDKVGAWSGGHLLSCSRVQQIYRFADWFLNNAMVNRSALLYEGAWTAMGAAAAGRPYGSIGQEWIILEPNYFNAATLPVPVLIYQYDANTAYVHPIGFAPCVFRASRGTVYAVGDIITISGEQYLWMHNSLLFKVS